MIHTHLPSAFLTLALLAFALPAQSAPDDWKKESALISLQGAETVVRHPGSDTILYKNTDPQLAIEWGMANARNTVVLAGKYVVSDRIDIPRDGVTLIIDQGAELSAKPETKFTSPEPGFRSRAGTYHPFSVLIYNQKNNVRVLQFGTVTTLGFPVMFDGRNEKGDCGLSGGMVLGTGQTTDMYWLVDSKNVQAPIVTLTGRAAALSMEGCEDCHLGMLANLAAEPGAETDEALDLNTRSLKMETTTILTNGVSTRLIHEIPTLPDALPQFTAKTTIEVTLEGGGKKLFAKEVAFDFREK